MVQSGLTFGRQERAANEKKPLKGSMQWPGLVLWCLTDGPDVLWRVTYQSDWCATKEPQERR